MEEKNSQLIQEVLEDLLAKMGFSAQVEVLEDGDSEEHSFSCNINVADDSNLLIGQHGVNLQALQHIARLMVRKKTSEKLKFSLDINSYREQKNQSLIELAQQAASQAIDEKRAVVMKPMSTYERRVVHMELSKNPHVITESMGEGEGRKVVIKPADAL